MNKQETFKQMENLQMKKQQAWLFNTNCLKPSVSPSYSLSDGDLLA